jgi:hypothetical protein
MYDALKLDINSQHRLAICRPVGALDENFAGQLLRFLLALEELTSDPFDRVLDLTDVTDVSLNNAAVRAYADARRKTTARLAPFRSAIIAGGPRAEAVAKLYAELMKDSQIRVEIFRDAPSAAAWLAAPVEVFQPQDAHQAPRPARQ